MRQFIFLGLVAFALSKPVAAEIIVVNTTDDTPAADPLVDALDANGNISLRSAVMRANVNGQDDEIVLAAETYPLTLGGAGEDAAVSGDLDLIEANQTVIIRGAGRNQTIIDAGRNRADPPPLGDRVLHIFDDVIVEIEDLTITGGRTPDGPSGDSGGTALPGGGIVNNGTLTLTRTIVANNRTGDGGVGVTPGGRGGRGGGIFSTGNLTLIDSTVTNNSTGNGGVATNLDGGDGGIGGGIYQGGFDSLTLIDSTVSHNTTGRGGEATVGTGGDGGGIGRHACRTGSRADDQRQRHP